MKRHDEFAEREALETLKLLEQRQWVPSDAFFTQRLIARIERVQPGWRDRLRFLPAPGLALLMLLVNLTAAVWFFGWQPAAAEDRGLALTAIAEDYALGRTMDTIELLSQ
jgi:hypothetical protein